MQPIEPVGVKLPIPETSRFRKRAHEETSVKGQKGADLSHS